MEESKISKDQSTFSEERSVNTVALKLPTFWTGEPKAWFAQAEAQFVIRGIKTDDTKYYYLLAALDQDTAKRVVDLVFKPPSENKYTLLKQRLLDRFSLSPYRMAQMLLDVAPLGDRTPSQLMDDMLALMGDHEPCILFRTIFVDALPVEVRPHLVPSIETLAPRDLALLADSLITSNSLMVSSIANRSSFTKREPSPFKKNWCWLHRKWGNKAVRCEPPCNFTRSQKPKVQGVQGNWEDDHQ